MLILSIKEMSYDQRREKLPKFRTMRERVDYAYDELNVDIYYEGNYYFTILDHTQNKLIEMLTEEELDRQLESIRMDLFVSEAVTGRRV